MVQLDRLFQFAAGHVSHDAWMHSMALFEAGERRPLVWRFGVVAKIEFGGSGLTRLPVSTVCGLAWEVNVEFVYRSGSSILSGGRIVANSGGPQGKGGA